MKRLSIVLIAILVLVPCVFSQTTAVVKTVRGKVEVKVPGQSWKPAVAGMPISKGTTISTGFRSQAVLDVGPSEVTVSQLTRMQLEELLEQEGTVTTGLYLNVGRVSADVKSVEGLTNDFKLRSPVSTAAVRGTSIKYYDGYNLEVEDGIVLFITANNQSKSVFDSAFLSEGMQLVSGDDSLDASSTVTARAGKSEGVSKEFDSDFYGGIVLTFEKP